MDNHVILVTAMNVGYASCVIDQRGDILAWNEGDQDLIFASARIGATLRSWNGCDIGDLMQMQTRPHLYGVLTS